VNAPGLFSNRYARGQDGKIFEKNGLFWLPRGWLPDYCDSDAGHAMNRFNTAL
jgi:hypothetical protein